MNAAPATDTATAPVAVAVAPPGAGEDLLPVGPLADWLRTQVAPFDGGLHVRRLAGGQSNPTFRVDAGPNRWVVRRKPPGVLLASAHAVEREYRVMRALAATDVPVPAVHGLCEDASVIGSPFYVMDFVDGRVFADPSLPGLSAAERAAVYDAVNRTIAALHRVDVAAAGLAGHGRAQGYLARQVDRWTRQYHGGLDAGADRIEALEALAAWLPRRLPTDEREALVHGDFRIDNLLFHPTEPRVLAVLDWELSTVGHPLADFAYHLMAWRLTPGEFRGLVGHDLAALGIPDERAYAAAYAAHIGQATLPDLDVHLAFVMFRLACILHGIAARARQGNAAAGDAREVGARARPIAEAGWRLARSLGA